jgi:hypothetical protein
MATHINTTKQFKILSVDTPITSDQLERDAHSGWIMISSLSYQENGVWRFVYYFKNRNYGL